MKKIIIALTSLALVIFALNGCGGGAGSASKPRGENPGTPSVVQLTPSQVVAQTNSVITLHAKVLDGNGTPVSNRRVTFTDLSPIGVLSSTTAETNDSGIATVTLKSTTDGFATVQAEINKGVDQVRDRKTMVFSSNTPLIQTVSPSLTLSVDDGDGTPNQPADFNLFKGTNDDNQRLITAFVSIGGIPIEGSTVTFGSDHAFKVGTDPSATCSDGSTTCEVIFPQGNTAMTNAFGDAAVLVEVVPTALSSIETTLNITAQADNGAFNLITLFLHPVVVQTVIVSANPQTVASGGTSTITAQALTNAGTPVPDGTTMNFTVSPSSNGSVDTPFAQTTSGIATAKFTAATVASNTSATINAAVNGTPPVGSVTVTITAPPVTPPTPPVLKVTPSTALSVGCTGGGSSIFVVTGGTPPYKVTSSDPNVTLTGATGTPPTVTINASGGSFTATVAALSCGNFPAATNNVSLVVTDSANSVVAAILPITNP